MSFTDELLDKTKPLWDAQLDHPFVQGLGEDTLSEEKFHRWIRQDFQIAWECSRAFAQGAAKATTESEMNFLAASIASGDGLDLTLLPGSDFHKRLAERSGLSADELKEGAVENTRPNTRAYMDHLRRASVDGELPELVAAVLPYIGGYAVLAKKIQSTYHAPEKEVYNWLAAFTGDDFQQFSSKLKSLLNDAAGDLDTEQRMRLTEIFSVSSYYQWNLWDSCWNDEQWRPNA
ncbi:MAG: hypothetical protein ABEN55_06505 [Bradymonadaceae bacterium]